MISTLYNKLYGNSVVVANLRGQHRIPYLPEEQLAALRDARLRAIVRYASKTVPYYRDFFQREGIDPRTIQTVADLERLPLLEKDAVQKDPHLFVSTSRRGKNAISFTTSGTTGTPLKVYHDPHSILANIAFGERERKVRSEVFGKDFRFRTLSINYPGSIVDKVRDFCHQKTFIPIRPERHTLSVLEPVEHVIKEINRYRPDVVISYGSYLETLFRILTIRGTKMYLPRVIVYGGDGMSGEGRELIETKFGILVHSTYQAVESFKIGFFCEERRGFHLHSDLCHVKIIGPDGAKLAVGEKGEVVISNFVNRGTVLLNYRLGDIATVLSERCSCGRTLPLLSELEGRAEDIIYLADGGFVHPRAVWGALKKKPEVLQYQLIQHETEKFELRLVTEDKNSYKRVITDISTSLQRLLGASAKIDHGYYEELEREAGGKFRAVISLCRQ
jgi:phenylacetate-CoA ligase